MARIPTAADVSKIRPISQPEVRVSQAAAGVGLARAQQDRGDALTRVGTMLNQEATKQRDIDDTNAAKEADRTLQDKLRKLRWGDPEAGTRGYYNLNGSDALGDAHTNYTNEVDRLYQEAIANAPSNGARRRLEQVASTRRQSALEGGLTHQSKQREIATVAGYEASIQANSAAAVEAGAMGGNNTNEVAAVVVEARKAAAHLYGDWTKIDASVAGNAEKITAAKRVTEQFVLAKTTAIHKDVIDQLKIDSPAAATAYFNKNKAAIAPSERDNIEASIKQHSVATEGVQLFDQLRATHRDTRGLLEAIRKNAKNPEVRAHAMSLARAAISDRRQAEAAGKDAAFKTIYGLMADGVSLADARKSHPQAWDIVASTPGAMSQAMATERAILEGNEFSTAPTGVWEEWINLTPAQQATYDTTQLTGRWTKLEASMIMRQKQGAVIAIEQEKQRTEPYANMEKYLIQGAPAELAAMWKGKTESGKTAKGETAEEFTKDQQLFRNHAFAWLKQYQDANQGKSPTVMEMRQAVREIYSPGSQSLRSLTRVEIITKDSGVLFDDKKVEAAYLVDPKSLGPNQVPRVPYERIQPEDKRRYQSLLRERGVKPTNEILSQLAGAEAIGDNARYTHIFRRAQSGISSEQFDQLTALSAEARATHIVPLRDIDNVMRKRIVATLQKHNIRVTPRTIGAMAAANALGDRPRMERILDSE